MRFRQSRMEKGAKRENVATGAGVVIVGGRDAGRGDDVLSGVKMGEKGIAIHAGAV